MIWVVTVKAGKTKFYRSTEKLIYKIWFFYSMEKACILLALGRKWKCFVWKLNNGHKMMNERKKIRGKNIAYRKGDQQ